tara:strand:- start:30446 stop:31552 length:1107 start_codon:yes stop_codon:yes gene_type:complete
VRLAGTYHPITYLLNKIPEYIPGLNTVDAIWCNADKDILSSFSSKPAQGETKLMFQKWRNSSKKQIWLSNFDPLKSVDISQRQLSLNDEGELNTLLLFFESPYDEQQDLIAITFPENLFLRNYNLEFSGLSTQEKSVLSNLLSSILHTEHKRCLEEKQFLQELNVHSKHQSDKVKTLTAQLSTAENLYSSAIHSIIEELLSSYEKKWGIDFKLDTKLVKYFAKEKLPLSQIKTRIDQIATMAYHLNIGEQEILLDESFIISSIGMPDAKEVVNSRNDQKDKVIDLLNRYEKAAERVDDAQAPLNAKEIAKRLDPPVTPPAITDAVKKNKRKIAYFLKQYPEKWRLIRSAIRPIRVIDENETDQRLRIS